MHANPCAPHPLDSDANPSQPWYRMAELPSVPRDLQPHKEIVRMGLRGVFRQLLGPKARGGKVTWRKDVSSDDEAVAESKSNPDRGALRTDSRRMLLAAHQAMNDEGTAASKHVQAPTTPGRVPEPGNDTHTAGADSLAVPAPLDVDTTKPIAMAVPGTLPCPVVRLHAVR